MHERNRYGALMSATWSGPRLAAAIAGLKDTGMNESQIARAAGVGRSTVNRWARGANRPDHDPVRRLAAAVFRRRPDIARELVEASGYPWTEPDAAPEPPPIPADVLAVIRQRYTPEQQEEIIEMLTELTAPAEPSGEGRTGGGASGTRRAG